MHDRSYGNVECNYDNHTRKIGRINPGKNYVKLDFGQKKKKMYLINLTTLWCIETFLTWIAVEETLKVYVVRNIPVCLRNFVPFHADFARIVNHEIKTDAALWRRLLCACLDLIGRGAANDGAGGDTKCVKTPWL